MMRLLIESEPGDVSMMRARAVSAALERRRHHERLEARAGLEDVGDGAVAVVLGLDTATRSFGLYDG